MSIDLYVTNPITKHMRPRWGRLNHLTLLGNEHVTPPGSEEMAGIWFVGGDVGCISEADAYS